MFSRYFSLMHLLTCPAIAADRCGGCFHPSHPSTAIPAHDNGPTSIGPLPLTARARRLSYALFSSLVLTTTVNRASPSSTWLHHRPSLPDARLTVKPF
jgi:hypothetical protein